MALLVWPMGHSVIPLSPDSYCAPDLLSTAHRTTGYSVDTTFSEFNQRCQAILSSSATWLDRAVHPFALFNALTAILLLASFGALTALFNSSNSETVLIISALFVTYSHFPFLHPSSFHEGFFQHSLPPTLNSCVPGGSDALDNP